MPFLALSRSASCSCSVSELCKQLFRPHGSHFRSDVHYKLHASPLRTRFNPCISPELDTEEDVKCLKRKNGRHLNDRQQSLNTGTHVRAILLLGQFVHKNVQTDL